MIQAIIIAVGVVIGLPLLILVHHASDRVCVRHARRFCEKNGLEISRVRFRPAFNESGVKTEFTLVQLDCRDAQKERRLVLLVVWPFGVRKQLKNENYPDLYDEKWPVETTAR